MSAESLPRRRLVGPAEDAGESALGASDFRERGGGSAAVVVGREGSVGVRLE